MKFIAFYLPQFHSFPENDAWWGKGFTEWTNTKKAKPLFKGHYQPHTPLHNNYYDLTNPDVMYNQVKMAKEYGIYGFCFYHYWFEDGKKLMEKPVEKFLADKNLDMPFCLSWANEAWTRRWDGGEKDIIMPQKYGDAKDWERHFKYLLPYLKDDRYITVNGKPLVIIYKPGDIPNLEDMLNLWDNLACCNGLNGLCFFAQGTGFCANEYLVGKDTIFDGYIMYEPGFTYNLITVRTALKHLFSNPRNFARQLSVYCSYSVPKVFKKIIMGKNYISKCRTDLLWKSILSRKPKKNFYLGAFATWDNSSRCGKRARIATEFTVEKYKKFINMLVKKAKVEYGNDFIFYTAWNEWAEGAHLEPDEKYGYAYLEGVKEALINNDEWPFDESCE